MKLTVIAFQALMLQSSIDFPVQFHKRGNLIIFRCRHHIKFITITLLYCCPLRIHGCQIISDLERMRPFLRIVDHNLTSILFQVVDTIKFSNAWIIAVTTIMTLAGYMYVSFIRSTDITKHRKDLRIGFSGYFTPKNIQMKCISASVPGHKIGNWESSKLQPYSQYDNLYTRPKFPLRWPGTDRSHAIQVSQRPGKAARLNWGAAWAAWFQPWSSFWFQFCFSFGWLHR